MSCFDIKLVVVNRDEYNILFYYVKKFVFVFGLCFFKLNKVVVLIIELGCMEY